MTLYYFDTSALIKRYIEELGSEAIEKIWPSKSKSVASASLTYAEMYAAFFRLNRDGRLSGKSLSRLCSEFESDWRTLAILEFLSPVRRQIPQIISKVALRGADLVHMVTVVYLAERSIDCELITFDTRMLQAADDLGVRCRSW